MSSRRLVGLLRERSVAQSASQQQLRDRVGDEARASDNVAQAEQQLARARGELAIARKQADTDLAAGQTTSHVRLAAAWIERARVAVTARERDVVVLQSALAVARQKADSARSELRVAAANKELVVRAQASGQKDALRRRERRDA